MGSMIAKVPQLVPVLNAIPADTRKTRGRKMTGGSTSAVTCAT
jgi:hypothetical protein